jgi:tRNA G18 (ribose-2'-O)-methylase SpoU
MIFMSQFFVIAHNIRSLYNVGSIFRTSDAFGVSELLLTGYTGTPKNPKLAKVSLGAEKTVPWRSFTTVGAALKKIKAEHPKLIVYGLENNLPKQLQDKVTSLSETTFKFPCVLILGEEVSGIPKSLLKYCDGFVEIPMQGSKESLNVSVAFGVAAYEISLKIKKQKLKP